MEIRAKNVALGAALVAALGASESAEAASLKPCGGNLEPGSVTTRATPKVSCALARKLRRLALGGLTRSSRQKTSGSAADGGTARMDFVLARTGRRGGAPRWGAAWCLSTSTAASN